MYNETYKPYVHNPPHLFRPGAAYMITAGTYQKLPYLRGDQRKRLWLESLDFVLRKEQWQLTAWVILDNHYHVLIHAPEAGAGRLPQLVRGLHAFTARRWNHEDRTIGRRVWWNYWDTCLSSVRAYYARINYIHWNPVRHSLADRPGDYPFSSYAAFAADANVWRLGELYPFDRVEVPDDY